jgi:glucose-1-phosphate thymidylyltransferase
MKALILAAGYAVRLEPLTTNMPKSLLEIGGRRIIDRILEKLASLGELGSVYVVTNAKFFDKFKAWADGLEGMKPTLINDGSVSNETRLGAIKDLALAIEKGRIDDDDLLVVAGDNLFEFDIRKFIDFARRRKGRVSVALCDIKDREAAKRFGVVRTAPDGRITDFEEKPQEPQSTLISTGIYYFPQRKIGLVKEYMKQNDRMDAPGYYLGWLSKADEVYGFSFEERWYDIGDIGSYKRADDEYKRRA